MNNNNALQVFSYKEQQVRTTLIDGEVWFVAADVCNILELTNPTEALRALDEDEKNTLRISEGIRGNPTMNIINEPGLYALVLRSNKPEAKAFSRWVRHDVLPTIRKTGTFSVQAVQEKQQLQKPYMSRARFNATERIIKAALNCKDEKDFQAVIALDKAFLTRNGYSPLEDAGFVLEKIVDHVDVLYLYSSYGSMAWCTNRDDVPDGVCATEEKTTHYRFQWKHNLPSLEPERKICYVIQESTPQQR